MGNFNGSAHLASLAIGAWVSLASTPPAQAGLSSCGDISVEAEAECSVEIEGGCEIQCEPVSFTAACSAELYAECRGECDVNFDAECTGSCEANCQAECEVDPGDFDCNAECQGGCEVDCSADCSSNAEARCEANGGGSKCVANAKAECEASCTSTCSGECSASCEGTPPSAKCEGKCEASCEGQCRVEANAECQVDCQAKGYAACKTDLKGGCEAACSKPEGALFCDGQYVDHGDNLHECISALNAVLKTHVKGEASAEGECRGNKCEAEADASGEVTCSAAPVANRTWPLGAVALFSFAGLLLTTRRRR